MGIFSSIVKYVPWSKVASLAMMYGPEIFRQVREKIQPVNSAGQLTAEESDLLERIGRLDKLLLEQENIISEQAARNSRLEESCRAFEAQLGLWKIIASIATIFAILIFVLLIIRW